MKIIEELRWRGLVQDISDEKILLDLKPGERFYCGFDPSAPSLQLGNLVPLCTTAHLGRAGLEPIILFGGATGSIGDPSGKDSERILLNQGEVEANVEFQINQLKELFGKLGLEVTFVNNLDWTKDVSVLEFLRDIGKHFSVNYMIAKEVVKTRLNGSGISFTEFTYMLLQANDFLHLYDNFNCKLQIGGSDQWGNITAGLELIRRKRQAEVAAFSIPLLTDSSGRKLGKSSGTPVWLDPERTSPFKLHQFLLNTDDDSVIRLLKVFTFLSRSEIEELAESVRNEPEKRVAQRALADAVCDYVHGPDSTVEARKSAEVLFGGSTRDLSDDQLAEIFQDVPSSELPRSELEDMTNLDLLAKTGLVKSRGDGRRLIANGGAYLNNERVTDGEKAVTSDEHGKRSILIARSGKKNYHLVRVVD